MVFYTWVIMDQGCYLAIAFPWRNKAARPELPDVKKGNDKKCVHLVALCPKTGMF